MDLGLRERRALITGGSRGIGLAGDGRRGTRVATAAATSAAPETMSSPPRSPSTPATPPS
jgi:NAD(P)-dependent dehydrogenase (short-subunit alcohol dehydrogenase family)